MLDFNSLFHFSCTIWGMMREYQCLTLIGKILLSCKFNLFHVLAYHFHPPLQPPPNPRVFLRKEFPLVMGLIMFRRMAFWMWMMKKLKFGPILRWIHAFQNHIRILYSVGLAFKKSLLYLFYFYCYCFRLIKIETVIADWVATMTQEGPWKHLELW